MAHQIPRQVQLRLYSDLLNEVMGFMGDDNVFTADSTLIGYYFNHWLERALEAGRWPEVCPYGEMWPVDRFNRVELTPESRLKDRIAGFYTMDELTSNALNSQAVIGGGPVILGAFAENDTSASADGVCGYARDLDGTNDFFEVAYSGTRANLGDENWSATIAVNVDSVGADGIILSDRDSASTGSFELYTDISRTQIAFTVYNGSGTALANAYVDSEGKDPDAAGDRVQIHPSRWYFLAIYHDADNSEIGISIDGLPFETASTATIGAGGTNLKIGARYTTEADFFNGQVDVVGYWNRVLTLGDVKRLYNGGDYIQYPFNEQYYAIDTVFDVWRDDPTLTKYPNKVRWQPVPNGIQLLESSLTDVYLHYRRRYIARRNTNSAGDWLTGTSQLVDDVTFHAAEGQWFASRIAHSGEDPAAAANTGPFWINLGIPNDIYSYLVQGIYSDMLRADGEHSRARAEAAVAEDELQRALWELTSDQRYDTATQFVSHGTSQSRV